MLLATLFVGPACGPRVLVDDDAAEADDGDDTTTEVPPVPGTSTTDSTPPGDPTMPPEPEPIDGVCTRACQTAANCCDGQPDCPGPFPDNWSCQAGVCVFGGCANDEDCTFGGQIEGLVCAEDTPWGPNQCVLSCEAFDQCRGLSNWACSGITPAGVPYCLPVDLCDDEFGDPCQEFGTCDPARGCRCHADADCGVPGYVCRFD
jgi:hypothetical protein